MPTFTIPPFFTGRIPFLPPSQQCRALKAIVLVNVIIPQLLSFDWCSHVVQLVSQTSLEGKSQPRFTTGRWNPHHNCVQIATANDTCIRGWDLRTLQLATIFPQHSLLIAVLLTCSVACRAVVHNVFNR